MNSKQIERYLLRFLEVMECTLLEKTDSSVLVKLSPEADKELTGRSYYWSFVERTGAPAETMTMRLIWDPAAEARIGTVQAAGSTHVMPGSAPPGASIGAPGTSSQPAAGQASSGGNHSTPLAGTASSIANHSAPAAGQASSIANHSAPPAGTSRSPAAFAPAGPSGSIAANPGAAPPDSILGRYFGINLPPISRVPTDTLTFGSRRLEQIFQTVQKRGTYVRMFEEHKKTNAHLSTPYSTWLCVNYKVELLCDMKRDEIHSLGIHMGTGKLQEDFWGRLQKLKLTNRIPPNIFLKPVKLPLNRAVSNLETYLEKQLRAYDHTWAELAGVRLDEELSRIDGYYGDVLKGLEPEALLEGEQQYAMRREEALCQYAPRINVSVINCGLFHLREDEPT